MFTFESEIEKTVSNEVQIYAQKEYEYQLVETMLSKNASSHASISVDSMDIFESNITFAHYMFQNPKRALKLLDDAFQKVSFNISQTHALKSDMVHKENLHVRLIALPNLPEVYRSNLPNCSDVGQFLCISGTVVRTSTSKMLQYKKLWRCTKCKYQFIVEAEVEQGYICEKPSVCANPEWCNGKNFTLMSTDINTEWCKDYQEIKLQEQVYNLNIGTVPRSMWVILEDDLVELCYPGNDVIVSGVLIQQWKPLAKGSLIDINLVILAHNIEVQNKMSSGVVSKAMATEFSQFWQTYKLDPLSGRNFILSSICPQVFGLYIVKIAVALVLAGGVQKKSGSSKIRGDSHLLLIGDPGTAKSQFLKFATKVSSRSVLTSGIGTTNAGLTVSAIKEGGRWELEAGALVLADGGICCIDEFSCIKEQDKTCIHEAMEQQTISVAKAGLVCSLNTKCSILAATNPKGKYDESMTLSENTALGSPLLSRFDIILVLLDTCDENWDDMVSSYILSGRNILDKNDASSWPVEKMKNYFILIRHINPKVTPDAERLLRAYYTKQRSFQLRNASRTTPRLLQSLIRLAEGHARLMFRTEVLIIDAVMAIILIESSMLGNSILEGLSPLHTMFPDNPADEYKGIAEKVLQNLKIDLTFEENYEHFYEESILKNLLSDISSVWKSKENPYIFGTPPFNSSPSSDMLNKESNIETNEMSISESNFEESEEFFHKRAHCSNDNLDSCKPFQTNKTSKTDYTSSVRTDPSFHTELGNQVTTLSGLRNIYDISEVATSENVFHENISKNIGNMSVLQKILAEPDILECHGTVSPEHIVTSNVKNIFNNDIHQAKTLKNSLTTQRKPSSESSDTHLQRKNNGLEELSMSSEKEFEKSDNSANSGSQYSKNLCDKSNARNSIFHTKKSLADQLKNYAFSKSHSQQNILNEATTSSFNSGNKSKFDAKNIEKQEVYAENKTELNQHTIKKSAFKMIVEKSKKSQSQAASENLVQNVLNTSENLRNEQQFDTFNSCKNDQKTGMGASDSKNTSEIQEINNHIMTDLSSNNSATAEQLQPATSRKSIPDKLKLFAFSKTRKC